MYQTPVWQHYRHLDLLFPEAEAPHSRQFSALQLVSGKFILTALSLCPSLLHWGVSLGAGARDISAPMLTIQKFLCGGSGDVGNVGQLVDALFPPLPPRGIVPSLRHPSGLLEDGATRLRRQAVASSGQPPDLPCRPHSVCPGLSSPYRVIHRSFGLRLAF